MTSGSCAGAAATRDWSLYSESSTARDQVLQGPEAVTMNRRLNDGREFRIVKLYYRPDTLAARLAQLGWRMAVRATESYFLYGWGGVTEPCGSV